MSVELANESGVDVDAAAIVAVARFALDEMGVHPLAELSILLVDESVMTDLHVQWMDLPGPTDVLSFPMDEIDPTGLAGPAGTSPAAEGDGQPTLLGDIVLCPSVAATQAAEAGHGVGDELALLTVHGVLHILGYDHAEPDEERQMFALQRRILADFTARP